MSAKNSLIAIGALSAYCCFLQGMKSPEPVSRAHPAGQRARDAQPAKLTQVPFSPPTHKLVSRQLKAGTVHVYPLPLKAGERVEIIAYQDGVDLQAAFFNPAEQHLFTVNSLNGAKGPERLFWVAESSGQYRIEISGSEQKAAGAYRISLNDEGVASERDKQEAAAEQLFYQAAEERKKGMLDQVKAKLLRAAQLWEATGTQGRQADAWTSLGFFLYDQAKLDEALQALERARSLYRGLGRTADEGMVENSIGFLHEERLDLRSAQNSFNLAITCGERGNDRSVLAAAYQNLGGLFRKEGRAEEALASLQQARQMWKGLNVEKEAATLISMGELFVDEGKWKAAKEKYQEAWSVLGVGKSPRAKSWVLQGLGKLYLKTHEPEQALRLFRKALAIQQQAGFVNALPTSLNGIADAFLNEKRPLEALVTFREALRIYEKQADLKGQARVLTNLGWTLAKLGRYKEARSSLERALTLAKALDPWTVAAARLGLARLEEDRGNPIAAQRQAEDAVKSVEDLRAAAGPGFRIPFFATKQDTYDTLIEILLWEHSLRPTAGFDAQALRVSEQARSRGLLDRIAAASSRGKSPLSPPPILSLPEIQSHLDFDTLLLEYHLGNQASQLWVVGSSFYRVIKLPARSELEGRISRVAQLLPNSQRREKFLEARRAAMDLSRTLLGPAIPWLGSKRLLISAPDSLQAVNFRALPDPGLKEPSPEVRTWPKPLTLDHEIVQIPSASVELTLHSRAANRLRAPDLLMFIGDPVLDYDDERLSGLAGFSLAERSQKSTSGFSPHFNRLKRTEDEGNAILQEAGRRGVGAFGFNATRELVTSGQLSTYANLHFATHGVLLPDDAGGAAIVLSLWDQQGHPIDGLLKASDIYLLDLPADLVVLSACDTGLGEQIAGEGIVGLSQAFMAAGATRVMVSLWPVDDDATFKLMKKFYHEYLVNGLSPSQALRAAQIAMWKDPNSSAPFFWGGFEVQGDWQWVRDPR